MNEVTIWGVIIAAVSATGFWECVKLVLEKLSKKKRSVQEEALLGLLHDRLYYLLGRYQQSSSLSADEFNNLNSLYIPYRKLGGNGVIEKMYEQVSKLPIQN